MITSFRVVDDLATMTYWFYKTCLSNGLSLGLLHCFHQQAPYSPLIFRIDPIIGISEEVIQLIVAFPAYFVHGPRTHKTFFYLRPERDSFVSP